LRKISTRQETRFIINPNKGGLVESSEILVDGKVVKRTKADLVKSDDGSWFPRETLSESVNTNGEVGLRIRTVVHRSSVGHVKGGDFQMSMIPWKGGVELSKYLVDGRVERQVFVEGAWLPEESFNKLALEERMRVTEPLGLRAVNAGSTDTRPKTSVSGEKAVAHTESKVPVTLAKVETTGGGMVGRIGVWLAIAGGVVLLVVVGRRFILARSAV
jgi:hypothetical protein